MNKYLQVERKHKPLWFADLDLALNQTNTLKVLDRPVTD
jgi:hypothetical protein